MGKRKIGLVVNPIAGMGGSVGLKGTDGIADKAIEMGATPVTPGRALQTLKLISRKNGDIEIVTSGGDMGGDIAREAGLETTVVYRAEGEKTTAGDTVKAVKEILDKGVELVIFVGGDGTAADVLRAYSESNRNNVSFIGVPSGVKMYSSVFAVNPEEAGLIALASDEWMMREVIDIENKEDDELDIKGYLPVAISDEGVVQPSKQLKNGDIEGAVIGFLDDIREDTTYILGPGGTLMEIKKELGFDGSHLGVDVWRDGEVVIRDASEEEILANLTEKNTVVISPIGGQGFIFGRGNQQISPKVIRNSEIYVVSSPDKLRNLDTLRVDTGDPELDEELSGWIRIRTGRRDWKLTRVN